LMFKTDFTHSNIVYSFTYFLIGMFEFKPFKKIHAKIFINLYLENAKVSVS